MNFRRVIPCKPMNLVKADIVLKKVYDFLDFYGFKPRICYGTLLGAVRNNDFISNDGDIDLILDKKYYKNVVNIVFNFVVEGCLIRCVEDDIVKLEWDGVCVDLYFFSERNLIDKLLNRVTWRHKWRTCFIDNFYLIDESFVEIRGCKYRSLFFPKFWLYSTYGSDWMIPQNKKGNTWTLTTKIRYFLTDFRKYRFREFKKGIRFFWRV